MAFLFSRDNMKLRVYTPEETEELLNKFIVISEYTYKINDAAYNIMNTRYIDYIYKFKWSLFKWKPLSFNEFTEKLNCFNKPRFQDYSLDNAFNSEDIFMTSLFKEDAKIFRGTSFFSSYYDNYMVKKGCDALSKEETKILTEADFIVDNFLTNYELRKKYTALVKYAHRPFEFDESDISWLELIERLYNKAKLWNLN